MLSVRDVLQLQEGENVVAVVRRHASSVVPGFVAAGMFIALPFFFLFPFVKLGFTGAAIISLFLAAGLYFALKTLLLWDANALVITDRRIVVVQQQSPWDRQVTVWPLFGMSITVERRGVLDAAFKTGGISLLGAGAFTPVVFSRVAKPDEVAAMLHKLRDNHSPSFKIREL
jgi:Zn-dependent protease with chaperone function